MKKQEALDHCYEIFLKSAITIFIAILFAYAFSAAQKYFGFAKDQPLEQAIEKYIEDEAGIEIDFTPD